MKRKTICKNPTCPSPAADDSSYCETHKAQAIAAYEAREQVKESNRAYNARRPEDDKYYNTAEWRRLRADKMSLHPDCQAKLEGCTGKGQIVHHRTKRKDGGADTLENLQSVCKSCHNKLHNSSTETKEKTEPLQKLLPDAPKKERRKIDYRALVKLLRS